MRRPAIIAIAVAAALGGCDDGRGDENAVRSIGVSGEAQQQLHEADDLYRIIALKRAIRDAGYRCQRVERSGFVGKYQNLDMWAATCNDSREWAVFIGPDGSAQVRDCKDVERFDLPKCEITSKETTAGDIA